MGRPIFFDKSSKKRHLSEDGLIVENPEARRRENARHNTQVIKAIFEKTARDCIEANKESICQQAIVGGIAPEAIPQFLESVVQDSKEKMYEMFLERLQQRMKESEGEPQQPPPRSANM